MKQVSGEKVNNIYKIILVGLPRANDQFIKVAYSPVSIIDAVIYYSDNTSKTYNETEELMKAISYEFAKKQIPDLQPEDKISFKYFFEGQNFYKVRNKLCEYTTTNYYRN